MSATAASETPQKLALLALSDEELVDRIYEDLVARVDDDLRDEFYLFLEEAFERFAPHAEIYNIEGRIRRDTMCDAEAEIAAHRKFMHVRAREREAARLIRSAFAA